MIRKDRQTEERHIGQWGPWADECQISKTSRLDDDDDCEDCDDDDDGDDCDDDWKGNGDDDVTRYYPLICKLLRR